MSRARARMIQIAGLSKTYNEKKALDSIDLTIEKGEILGLLGPNGAGKTTFLMMLSTLLQPTSGKALIEGQDILRESLDVKRRIGVIFQEPSLDEALTVYENIWIQAVLQEIPKEVRAQEIKKVLDLLDLTEHSRSRVSDLSGGFKRRVEIARALVHNPTVLILDEPTLGLDPQSREVIWKHIKEIQGCTVLIATNYIEEAEALCTRLALIDKGRIVALGTSAELRSSLDYLIGKIKSRDPEGILRKIAEKGLIKNVSIENGQASFRIDPDSRSRFLTAAKDLLIDSLEIRLPTLQDVFFHYTGRKLQNETLPFSKKGRGLGRRRMG